MPSKNKQCIIEDMGQLLDHINSFEQDITNTDGLSSPSISEEHVLFKNYLKDRIQDIQISTIKEFHQITQPSTK